MYLPEQLDEKIKQTAKRQNKSKAAVMRDALEKGIKKVEEEESGSGDVMLKLAELGKRYKFKGPKDSSVRIDELLWDKNWDENE